MSTTLVTNEISPNKKHYVGTITECIMGRLLVL